LRVDPYHRTTAERHPDVAAEIRAEADRVLSVDRTLVHGDYSPKNVLVGPSAWVLDFEVAHWGDPAFDTAFMCNHLYIKSIYNHDCHAAYADAAERFWTAYDRAVDWDIERETVAELGVLMLARVDGKSPVEYVEREAVADALRRVAKRTLRGEAETLDEFAALAREEAEAL
jgi:5-methylthioribose kinase